MTEEDEEGVKVVKEDGDKSAREAARGGGGGGGGTLRGRWSKSPFTKSPFAKRPMLKRALFIGNQYQSLMSVYTSVESDKKVLDWF